MRLFYIILIIFLILTNGIKADTETQVLKNLKNGGNLIFIRHAYAPGGGDPDNFDLNDCSTQRNLSETGREQAKKIGKFFHKNQIPIDKVISSEWCRCKETAEIAFKRFETKNFLNSFFSTQFAHNRKKQVIEFEKFLNSWDQNQNIIFVTHYVVISEILNYAPSSGEIVISDKSLKVIDTLEIEY